MAIFSIGKAGKKQIFSYISDLSTKCTSPMFENFPISHKLFLFSDPIISLLGISPKDTSPEIENKICTRLFTVALTVIVKYFKQSECPSTGDRKTMECYGMWKNRHTNKQMNQGSFLYPILEWPPRERRQDEDQCV